MLSGEKLCRIHAECGADYLSTTCGSYPRIAHTVGESQDTALTLSCPEAARLVLLIPDLIYPEERRDSDGLAIDSALEGARRLQAWFWPIRGAVIALIRNRSYALWQRLFLLGILCRRLDSIGQGEIERSVPDFLKDFEHAVAAGSLRNAMEALPFDRESQLDVVLQLAGMMLHRSQITPRFVDCVHAFTTGIGNGPTATLKSLTANYSTAYDRYYAPFFSRYPHILENYLINTVVRCEYPFGREVKRDEGASKGAAESPTMVSEHAALIAQLALIKGLLIGVAGYYRDEFAPVHVVHTVQAASRHFEHHPEFLKAARALLVECGMDGAQGMAILLRNRAPMASTPALRDKRVPIQTRLGA
jgi:lysine-N-methylase